MEREEVGTRPTRDGFQAVRSNLGRDLPPKIRAIQKESLFS